MSRGAELPSHEAATPTKQPRVGEGGLAARRRLHRHAQHQEQVARVDAPLAPVPVGHPRRRREGDAVAQPVDARDPAEVRARRVVHEGVPLWQGEEAGP